MFVNSLSGRFLVLSVIFVMLAEVLIFVPSVARFRQDYLLARVEKAQIASLAVLASEDEMITAELAQELLANAGVYNVVLRRDAVRQLVLSSPVPIEVVTTVDLRDPSAWYLVEGAMMQLVRPREGTIRVIGAPTNEAGLLIEVTMPQAPLVASMIDYGKRILLLSAVISVVSAALLFLAVRRFMVRPIKRVVHNMQLYSEAPEDARRIMTPVTRIHELRSAEDALEQLQTQLTGSLKQKDRLAQLGGAVAKISHDLRNILTTATLLADRMEMSEDPAVKRSAPKLVNSLSRAVNLCESTLAFGRAEEPPPALTVFPLAGLIEDIVESEKLATAGSVDIVADIPTGMMVRADGEQIFRVLGNLVRNARQAMESLNRDGEIRISASEDEKAWCIFVTDNGPGLPPKAQKNMFMPFEGSVRKGGTGLGLVIAAELVRGHGGRLELVRTDEAGTQFALHLPKETITLSSAAE